MTVDSSIWHRVAVLQPLSAYSCLLICSHCPLLTANLLCLVLSVGSNWEHGLRRRAHKSLRWTERRTWLSVMGISKNGGLIAKLLRFVCLQCVRWSVLWNYRCLIILQLVETSTHTTSKLFKIRFQLNTQCTKI